MVDGKRLEVAKIAVNRLENVRTEVRVLSPGNPAVVGHVSRRPVALRPRLSSGLPLSWRLVSLNQAANCKLILNAKRESHHGFKHSWQAESSITVSNIMPENLAVPRALT